MKHKHIRLQNPTTPAYFSTFPEVVGMEITGRCQLQCRHCFNLSGPENQHELLLAVIVQFLDEMVSWGVGQIRLSGGEPTFHRRFREVIDACARREITVALNTHGVYSPALLAYLKEAPVAQFIVSIDGLEDHHDAIRGQGTFIRAISSCRELHRAGKNVLIGCHVGRENQGDVPGLIALAAEIGVDIKIAPIRPLGRALEHLPESLLRPEEYLALVSRLTRLRRQFAHIRILTDFDIVDGVANEHRHADPGKSSCKAGRTMINVNYDGGIYPCAFFVTPEATFCAGNIHHDSVAEVWRDSPVFWPFRSHQKPAACQACRHYRARCLGGCPALAYFTTGYLDGHDPTCFATLEGLE